MTRTLLVQAFGNKIDLYEDVLQCPRDASNTQLRKAYYKRARDYHPDKNANDETAKIKFQAISFAYNYLKDPERRKDYDEEGVLPEENDMDDNDGGESTNVHQDWKQFFDLIFGNLMSIKEIDSFALKYKMSPEEEADVLKYYTQFEGNLEKCLEFVMLSQEQDVERWMEDYIQPAIDQGKVRNYETALNRSRAKIQKKLLKKTKEQQEMEDEEEELEEIDEDETESEDSDQDDKYAKKKKNTHKKKPDDAKKTAKKAKPTQTKKKARGKAKSSTEDLVAAIRKNRGGNPFASLGARYGVDMTEEDPLDDAAFNKIQSKFKKKKK
eukprot:scaffold5392_cov107-Cylindrotheca_fusiformis.AAC.2